MRQNDRGAGPTEWRADAEARISFGVGRMTGAGDTAGIVGGESSRVRSAGDSQSSRAARPRRKPIRQSIEISDAPDVDQSMD